jgi:hypothetical protein
MLQYSCLGNSGSFTAMKIHVVNFYIMIPYSLVPGRLSPTFRRNIMLPSSRHVTSSLCWQVHNRSVLCYLSLGWLTQDLDIRARLRDPLVSQCSIVFVMEGRCFLGDRNGSIESELFRPSADAQCVVQLQRRPRVQNSARPHTGLLTLYSPVAPTPPSKSSKFSSFPPTPLLATLPFQSYCRGVYKLQALHAAKPDEHPKITLLT